MSEQVLSLWHGLVDARSSSQDILKAVAWRHDMSVADMLSPSRQKRYVLARREAMHELRVTLKPSGAQRSMPEIARQMGGLDHTTVLFNLRRHADAQAAKREAEAA